MSDSSKTQGLQVTGRRGRIVISIGPKALKSAYECSPVNDPDGEGPRFKVVQTHRFAKDVVAALLREEEDGTTPVHKMLDAAMEEAMEQGSEGIEEVKP